MNLGEQEDDVSVFVMLSDFVNVDAAGKINVIGGAVTQLGYLPNVGVTNAFALLAIARGGEKSEGRDFSLEITLKHATGEPVSLPGPAGPQVMRFGQNRRFPRPAIGGLPTEDALTIYFESGLPLAIGSTYYWEVSIDGYSRDDWRAYFAIPSLPSPPVQG